ncbi:hypothetical protein CC78DRAFT_580981 [Lojkania enalia]|uniref:Uncharacterized protein n=1 Tax=Lojkania enalia TaxID=147567 RepID=A0A9P4MZL6_9PLEO|nr:hypothetical protein CC78DRAFT_580981 [Didymosphaeria enalia]
MHNALYLSPSKGRLLAHTILDEISTWPPLPHPSPVSHSPASQNLSKFVISPIPFFDAYFLEPTISFTVQNFGYGKEARYHISLSISMMVSISTSLVGAVFKFRHVVIPTILISIPKGSAPLIRRQFHITANWNRNFAMNSGAKTGWRDSCRVRAEQETNDE